MKTLTTDRKNWSEERKTKMLKYIDRLTQIRYRNFETCENSNCRFVIIQVHANIKSTIQWHKIKIKRIKLRLVHTHKKYKTRFVYEYTKFTQFFVHWTKCVPFEGKMNIHFEWTSNQKAFNIQLFFPLLFLLLFYFI